MQSQSRRLPPRTARLLEKTRTSDSCPRRSFGLRSVSRQNTFQGNDDTSCPPDLREARGEGHEARSDDQAGRPEHYQSADEGDEQDQRVEADFLANQHRIEK